MVAATKSGTKVGVDEGLAERPDLEYGSTIHASGNSPLPYDYILYGMPTQPTSSGLQSAISLDLFVPGTRFVNRRKSSPLNSTTIGT